MIDGIDDIVAMAAVLGSVDVRRIASPVMSKAGAVMRDRAKEAAPEGPHLSPAGAQGGKGPGTYADTITFRKDGPLAVEVGALAVGQGNLSAILEYGQGPNRPWPHIVPQLDPEADEAARWLAKLIGDEL